MPAKLTTERFIERAKIKHDDFYSYEEVVYKNNSTNVIIICPTHQAFQQSPATHLKGHGCGKCGSKKSANSRKSDTATFIKKAKIKHKGKNYSYEKVVYKNNSTNVIIICPTHQAFQQTPSDHLSGSGCPECGSKKSANSRKSDTATFIKKAKIKHKGKKYSYKKTMYGKNAHERVTIICPKHQAFQQSPAAHLSGQGCPDCGGKKKLNTATFIKKAKINHKGKKYSYKKTMYGKNAHERVTIICPKHQEFQQTPSDHLSGKGCPSCVNKTQAEITEKLISHFPNYKFITGLKPKFLNGMEYDISTTLNNGIGVAVEYDGPQHYEPVRFGGMSMRKAGANFKTQKVRDHEKNKLSEANGIYLFRIPCYEYEDRDEDKHEDILYEIITQIEELEEYGHGYEMREDVR